MLKMSQVFFLLCTLFSSASMAGQNDEGFEDINLLNGQGWVFDNRSDFIGDLFWSQGSSKLFSAHDGSANSYLLGGAGQTAGNVLCDWLILPDLGFVEQLNFFTRTETGSMAADRLAVVHSPGGGTNTGPCVNIQPSGNNLGLNDFGDFQVLTMVNAGLTPNGYPQDWTEINVPVNATGRLALVYFVENVSQPPFNGNLIAIDSLSTGPGSPTGTQHIPVPGLSLFGVLMLSGLIILLYGLIMYFNKEKSA